MKKPIKFAFVSVYHKTNGLDLIIKKLHELGVSISSTGGTADFIEVLGVPVIKAETITGYPSILGGRVKTLHPKIMGAILARRENEGDIAQLEEYEIPEIDLVIVDLYPFQQTVDSGSSHEEIVEKIDIGGITLIRAAAKNYNDVTIVSSMEQYPTLLDILEKQGTEITEEQRYDFATKAFVTTVSYDLAIMMYFGQGDYYGIIGKKVLSLRYGENPWQEVLGLYKSFGEDNPLGLDKLQWLAGDPGYVNVIDVDRMFQTITHVMAGYHKNLLWQDMGFQKKESLPYVAIGVKHGNPCGAAINSSDPEQAIKDMLDGNLISIFGGAIITNFTITKKLAEIIRNYHAEKPQRIIDLVIAPDIDPQAVKILERKDDLCKMAILHALANLDSDCLDKSILIRKVAGGFLAQRNYDFFPDLSNDYFKKYGEIRMLFGQDRVNLVLGLAICATSNSNTIVLVKDQMLIGAGVGQKDRLECCDLAVKIAQEAGHTTAGALAVSDSFFPFPDGPGKLINAGVKTIFSLSGSVKDQLTIDLCEKTKVMLLMIDNKIARMFFAH
ncbi:MAG: bifunctional phosphoribosylaminoimidazolecarboxamide formyltransferase/IMP cyclohydrolase [bacterium]